MSSAHGLRKSRPADVTGIEFPQVPTIDLSQRQELLYVGMSRAKSLLVIVGRAATCAAFKDGTHT